MSAFEAFVNTELPLRRAMLTASAVGFDGDPNNVGAPAIIQGSPPGTWYFQSSANAFWRKDNLEWKLEQTDQVVASVNAFSNLEPLTFSVDPINGTDPAPNSFFQTQAAVNEFGAFQTVQAVWDALPGFIVFDVTVQLPAGTVSMADSVPSGEPYALRLGGRILGGAEFIIQGQPPSNWTEVVSTQTVTAATTTGDPQVTVSGTPFANLDLRNAFAEMTDGVNTSISPIAYHDDSNLFLTGAIQDDFGVFVYFTPTSVRVIKPSTILTTRDLSGSFLSGVEGGIDVNLLSVDSTALSTRQIVIRDVELDYDPTILSTDNPALRIRGSILDAQRILVDYQRMALARQDYLLSVSGSPAVRFNECIFFNPTVSGSSQFYFGGSNGALTLSRVSSIGIVAGFGMLRASRNMRITIGDCYFSQCRAPVLSGTSDGSVISASNRFGIANLCQDCTFSFVGIVSISGTSILSSLTGLRVENFAGPVIDITSRGAVAFRISGPSSGLAAVNVDGYYLDLDGAQNAVIDADVNGTAADFPSGAAGDILLPGGETLTWEDIVDNGTYIETDGNNRIRKI